MRSTGEDHTELDRDDALAVVRALPSDQEVVVAILDEAATWLNARGISQWPSPFPSDIVAKDIACGRAWLATLGGEPVGTVTLLDSDRLFWGDATERALFAPLSSAEGQRGTGPPHPGVDRVLRG